MGLRVTSVVHLPAIRHEEEVVVDVVPTRPVVRVEALARPVIGNYEIIIDLQTIELVTFVI